MKKKKLHDLKLGYIPRRSKHPCHETKLCSGTVTEMLQFFTYKCVGIKKHSLYSLQVPKDYILYSLT